MTDIIIVGGGLAGLSLAILCAKSGISVTLLERGDYPKHKVCGEYISMESYDFVTRLGVPLAALNLPKIHNFTLTSHHNLSASCSLKLGGFGISRFLLDNILAEKAIECGVILCKNERVLNIKYDKTEKNYTVGTQNQVFKSRLVVGAYGRISGLAQAQKAQHAVAFIGVKYHIDAGPASDTIEIHNFEGGYCGISQIEDGKFCLCYLAQAERLKALKGDIQAFEREVLEQNPFLKQRLAAKKHTKAVVTSQIEFGVNDFTNTDYPCIGDAAGFIPPITGNGMSLAFRAAAHTHKDILAFFATDNQYNIDFLLKKNKLYTKKYLKYRIKKGIFLQNLLFTKFPFFNKILMFALTFSPFLMRTISKQAVGKPF